MRFKLFFIITKLEDTISMNFIQINYKTGIFQVLHMCVLVIISYKCCAVKLFCFYNE